MMREIGLHRFLFLLGLANFSPELAMLQKLVQVGPLVFSGLVTVG